MDDDQEYESKVEVARYVIGSHLAREFYRGMRWGAVATLAVVIVSCIAWAWSR